MSLPDFTTQTAAAYKANIDSEMAINSAKLSLVILDAPELLISDATNGTATVNYTTATPASTTLSDANAVAAIIKVQRHTRLNSLGVCAHRVFLKKSGSGSPTADGILSGTTSGPYQVSSVDTYDVFSEAQDLNNISEHLIGLDGSSDFNYGISVYNLLNARVFLYLIGYYK